MSKQLEKKFRVSSFNAMTLKIDELGATPTVEVSATHYYAKLDSDDTLKMIDYGDRVEIHSVSTKNGLHSIDEEITVESVEEGMQWFKLRGYSELEMLKMHDQEYAYLDGGLALYTVEDEVFSVILGYSEDELPEMEKLFGLDSCEEISVPYNKYMAQLKKLRRISF